VTRFLPFMLLPALGLAQESVASQRVLDELKGIRASLERMEKGQAALIALMRVQFDEIKLTDLDAQRSRLTVQEQELGKEMATAARMTDGPPAMVMSADGTSQPAAPADTSALKARAAQASSSLKEVQRARQAVDQEIARIKDRIAALDRYLADFLR